MPGPDLTGVRRTVENLMDDVVRITRDTDGLTTGELNLETGVVDLDDPDGRVWQGRGIVTTATDGDGTVDLSGLVDEQERLTGYRALIPLAAPAVRAGDELTVTSSRRDTQLVGRRFRIVDPGAVGTYVVARILTMVEAGR